MKLQRTDGIIENVHDVEQMFLFLEYTSLCGGISNLLSVTWFSLNHV